MTQTLSLRCHWRRELSVLLAQSATPATLSPAPAPPAGPIVGVADQSLINLLLTGHAVSNVWDGDRECSGMRTEVHVDENTLVAEVSGSGFSSGVMGLVPSPDQPGPIGASSASTAARCQHHVADAYHVLRCTLVVRSGQAGQNACYEEEGGGRRELQEWRSSRSEAKTLAGVKRRMQTPAGVSEKPADSSWSQRRLQLERRLKTEARAKVWVPGAGGKPVRQQESGARRGTQSQVLAHPPAHALKLRETQTRMAPHLSSPAGQGVQSQVPRPGNGINLMKNKLDPEGLGIILLGPFLQEFFPDQGSSGPESFTVYHYNGLKQSNYNEKGRACTAAPTRVPTTEELSDPRATIAAENQEAAALRPRPTWTQEQSPVVTVSLEAASRG
ncbi:hypothetical protein QTO34_019353, partial [Cnephaeus nilssonii]